LRVLLARLLLRFARKLRLRQTSAKLQAFRCSRQWRLHPCGVLWRLLKGKNCHDYL
jgi:hypothetical protein